MKVTLCRWITPLVLMVFLTITLASCGKSDTTPTPTPTSNVPAPVILKNENKSGTWPVTGAMEKLVSEWQTVNILDPEIKWTINNADGIIK